MKVWGVLTARNVAHLRVRQSGEELLRLDRKDGVRRPTGAPQRLEPAERLVDDRLDRPVVAERGDTANSEAGCVAHLVGLRLADALAELCRVDAPVAGTEAEQRTVAVHEDER